MSIFRGLCQTCTEQNELEGFKEKAYEIFEAGSLEEAKEKVRKWNGCYVDISTIEPYPDKSID